MLVVYARPALGAWLHCTVLLYCTAVLYCWTQLQSTDCRVLQRPSSVASGRGKLGGVTSGVVCTCACDRHYSLYAVRTTGQGRGGREGRERYGRAGRHVRGGVCVCAVSAWTGDFCVVGWGVPLISWEISQD